MRRFATVWVLAAVLLSPGASWAAQDLEQLPPGRAEADTRIAEELGALFQRIDALRDVGVAVEAGVVRLTGTVAEAGAEDRAIELAGGRNGVVYVQSDIEWTASVSDRLAPTMDRIRELAYRTIAALPLLAVALVLVVFAGFVGSVLGRWGGPAFLRVRNPLLRNIVGRAVQAGVVLIGVLVALDLLDATALVGAVAGTAGLAGLAIGFAFKDIVENYLAGLLLAIRQPFEQNDHVVVEGFEGKVVRLTPRETILMTPEGNHVRLPNAMVFRSPMVNYTRNPRRRFHFEAGVGSNDDLALARSVGVGALGAMEGVLDDPPPQVLVTALGDSSVTMRFSGWVDQRQAEFARVRSEAIRLTKRALEDAGVTLPSPEYVVQMGPTSPEGATPSEGATRSEPAASGESRRWEDQVVDVSVDDAVDRQIAEDRRASDEDDLLRSAGGPPASSESPP